MASLLPLKTLVMAMLFFCCLLSHGKCNSEVGPKPEPEPFQVPEGSDFVGSVRSTIGILRQVISVVSEFAGDFGDFRLSNAVSDCLDLMDMSIDQLSWTLSVSQNPKGKDNSTGNVGSDMKTWLSGALINQDTCKDGFDGTNNFVVKNLIAGSLDQVTSLVYDILTMVKPTPNSKSPPQKPGNINGRKLLSAGDGQDFPTWLRPSDRRLLQTSAKGVGADAVVALDGSGTYTKIMDAVQSVPEYSKKRYVIYVKKGVYKEYVEIGKKKWNVMLIGDGVGATVITGNRNFVDGWTTYRSATFAVKGQGFIARDITFENTAGPSKHQAVAFRSDSDLSVLYRCSITGYQDTLYAHSQRQFYRECHISGTVDFIFGDGAVVFQSCLIEARQGLGGQKNTITAQGRKEPVENTGFSLQFCNLTVEHGVSNDTETYLGRPWKPYSRTVVMQSYIDGSVRPKGWLEWNGDFALDTLFYGEFTNHGPGAGLGGRVKWPGFRVFNSSAEASNFTVSQFIVGNTWLPSTGVKYTAGLSV